MACGLACIDGVLVLETEALIPVTDPGLVRGDGVFEAIRIYDERPFAIEAHLTRLASSAAGLRLAIDVEGFRGDVALMLAARGAGDDVLRLIATRGGRRIALFEPLPEFPATFSLGCVTYTPVRVLDGVKSLSYAANMLSTRLAQERGFDEALLVTPHDRVLECPTASFFAVRAGVLVTPPLSDHILDSITRRIVLAVADVREEPITLADLDTIDEAFIASSIREIAAVGIVEQRTLPAPGQVTAEVARLVRERIDSGVEN
jgi:branched-chain amino acid aminotransferase